MARTSKIDELNNMTTTEEKIAKKSEILSIEDYFGGMDIDEDDKEKRINLAHQIYAVLVYVLTVIEAVRVTKGDYDRDYYVDYIHRNLQDIYDSYFGVGFFDAKTDIYAEEFIDTTLKHIESESNPGYWTSSDRATRNAEDKTNTVSNSYSLEEAKALGYTKKQWITKHDARVRHTHEVIDFETIGIDEMFSVGSSEMSYPCDPSGSAKEIANCRCHLKYLK